MIGEISLRTEAIRGIEYEDLGSYVQATLHLHSGRYEKARLPTHFLF